MSGKKSAETQAGSVMLLSPPPQKKIDLRNAHAIRREMAAVYRDMRSGRIEGQAGSRLAYVLDMIRKAYETCVLEDRVIQLERDIDAKQGRTGDKHEY